MSESPASRAMSLPFAVEACWTTSKYSKLDDYVRLMPDTSNNFNVGVGQALSALFHNDNELFTTTIQHLQRITAQSLSTTNTSSLQECHQYMLQFHVLAEVETIGCSAGRIDFEKPNLLKSLNQRLDILGPFMADKQYILALRRATMELAGYVILCQA